MKKDTCGYRVAFGEDSAQVEYEAEGQLMRATVKYADGERTRRLMAACDGLNTFLVLGALTLPSLGDGSDDERLTNHELAVA